MSEAIFKYIEFTDGVSFENTVFDGFADFKYAKFYDPFKLNNVAFNSSTSFKYAKVEGKEFIPYLLENR